MRGITEAFVARRFAGVALAGALAVACQGSPGPVGPSGGATPTGSVVAFAGEAPPDGWVFCDGSEVSRTTYPELFAVIGVKYGVGDSVATFNLPNLQGRAVVGAGAGVGLTPRGAGDTFGEERHVLTVAELPAHTHTGTTTGVVPEGAGQWRLEYPGGGTFRGFSPANGVSGAGAEFLNHRHAFTSDATGGSQPHENAQPSFVLHYIIKT